MARTIPPAPNTSNYKDAANAAAIATAEWEAHARQAKATRDAALKEAEAVEQEAAAAGQECGTRRPCSRRRYSLEGRGRRSRSRRRPRK